MTKAVLFGSIGVLTEVSELERESFNQAFAEHSLDWVWEQDIYQIMLEDSDGEARIEKFADSQGYRIVEHHEVLEHEDDEPDDEDLSEEELEKRKKAEAEEAAKPELDAAALHSRVLEIFIEKIQANKLKLRDGVLDVINTAKDKDVAVGFASSANKDVVDAILEALSDELPEEAFQVVTSFDDVDDGKPSSEVYQEALHALDLTVNGVVAIEDDIDGVLAAEKGNITVYAYPGENTKLLDFGDAKVLDKLSASDLIS